MTDDAGGRFVFFLYLGFSARFRRAEGFSRHRWVLSPGQMFNRFLSWPLHTCQTADCTQE